MANILTESVALAEEEIEKLKPAALKLRHWVGIALLLLFLVVGVSLWAIDTSPGHRLLADRISALRPASGLRIRIGRIDGSIWNRVTLRDVRLSDPQGLFLEVPELAVDWRPTSWLDNRLDIRSLKTDIAIFYRVPRLRPSPQKRKAILPEFDIRVDRLSIRRLRIEPAVTGKRQLASIEGSADIAHGRARISLGAASTAQDRLRLLLDSEPDNNRFDVDLRLSAPKDGVVGALLGTRRPITAEVAGEGSWAIWKGHARADVSGYRLLDLGLDVRSGHYHLAGIFAPAPVTQGKIQRLSSPQIHVEGTATLAERQLTSRLSLRSDALSIDGKGVLDLATSAFDGVTVDAVLRKPPALFPNMTGRDVKLRLALDGPFSTAAFNYVLTAPSIAFDTTGFENVRIAGHGNLSAAPVLVPLAARADRVTGVGDVAGGILRNLRVDGVVKITSKTLTGEGLKLNSDILKGKLALFVDLATGKFEIGISGSLTRYLIPGVGLVDVLSDLKVIPGEGGHGTHVEGRGHVWVRRFDNAFLRSLAEGLPEIETRLIRDRDGIVHFVDLHLNAPGIHLKGTGYRRRDGTFYFDGAGTQRRYGPLKLLLDGNISRPKLDIALAHPIDSLGLAGVRLLLNPIPQGFDWAASGGSTLGPFDGNGRLLLQPGTPTLIAISRLDVTGTLATGGLRADPGGFTGKIIAVGGGIDGDVMFNPVGEVQRVETHLGFSRAYLAGMPDLHVRSGRLDGTFLLDPAGTSIEAHVHGLGLKRSGFLLGRLNADISMRGGTGHVSSNFAGSRGRSFDLQTEADLTPNRLSLSGHGTIDRFPIQLQSPAKVTRTEDGWRLDPTSLTFAGGKAAFSGRIGGSATEIEASVDRMPLSVLDVVAPELGFGGYATGRLSYRLPRGGRLPIGDADLLIRGLTRSGLVLSSRPIDLALKAKLTETGAAARAIASSEGKVVGRAQARVAPLDGDGTIFERLARAPLFAQLRYNGPADTIWRLTNVESIDISGPIAIAADAGGVLGNPRIRGSLKADNGRLESAITGTVIEKIHATGRFGGSVLELDDFSGVSRGGGTVSGKGRFDLASVNGFGMDLSIQADQARLLNRDDIAATVTGPLTIHSDGSGGLIKGDIKVIRGSFRLGQASVVEIPRLNVTENNRTDDQEDLAPKKPWRFDIKADARNQFAVTGLGLDSEWRASLVIGGSLDSLALTGRADLVRGGYEFAGRRFDLDRGTVRFLGQAPPDPVLDIVGSASVQGLNATLAVTGTGQKPEIRFSSVPAMPEDELLSRLLFGTSITNLSAPEALQLAAAVASLRGGGGGGLNPLNIVRRAAGLDRLRILPADTTTGQKTSIAAGKYIGRRTYVELITDGQGYSATRVEFQITRWLSLLSSISTIGQQSVNVRVSKDY